MSRRHAAEKREFNPDPKYGDVVLTKLMNALMMDGKKFIQKKSYMRPLMKLKKSLVKIPLRYSRRH